MPKPKDLTGQKFGKLEVISVTNRRTADRGIILRCKCGCGNIVDVPKCQLVRGSSISCGCYRKESFKIAFKTYAENFLVEQTALDKIDTDKSLRADNKSGCCGVSWSKSANLWVAYITLKGYHYHLGCYAKLEDAIKARKLAEEKYFEPIIEKYKKEAGA